LAKRRCAAGKFHTCFSTTPRSPALVDIHAPTERTQTAARAHVPVALIPAAKPRLLAAGLEISSGAQRAWQRAAGAPAPLSTSMTVGNTRSLSLSVNFSSLGKFGAKSCGYSSTHILARTSADHSVALGHSQIGRRLGTYLSLCRGRCRWWLSRLFAARCLSGTSLPSSTPVASKGRSPWKRRSQECHRRKPRMQPVTGRGAIGLVSDSQSTVPSHAQAIGRP